MNKKPLYLAVCFALAACASPSIQRKADDSINTAIDRTAAAVAPIGSQADGPVRGSANYADMLASQQSRMPVMRRSRSAFIGTQMVPVTHDDRLPTIFKREFSLAFDDRQAGRFITLQTVAKRLTEKTGVAVRIHPDVYQGAQVGGSQASVTAVAGGSSAVVVPAIAPGGSTGMQAQAGGMQASFSSYQTSNQPQQVGINVGDMVWTGNTLIGYLNNLTDRLGLAWEFRDNTIVVMRYVTESHEIATFQGGTDYSMNAGGNSNGSAGGAGTQNTATNQISITESGKSDALGSVERAVREMIANVPGSTVTRAEGSGRLLVKTTREMQSQVRDYIKGENASMLRQAQIQFDIYSVRTTNTDERGINWSGVLNTLSGMYGITASSPTSLTGMSSGTVNLNILSGGTSTTSQILGGSSAMINMLNQYGTNVQHRPVSLLSLNRTWARKSRLDTEYYLAETTPGPASSTGVGAPGLKTDKVTTGDQYVALPQILDNNVVLLKFGISLSDLLGLFDVSVGTGLTAQKVQAPRVQAVSDQYTIKLDPGQVMAITGLSRIVTTTDRRTLSEQTPLVFGGSKKTDYMREHFIIFVRPVIL